MTLLSSRRDIGKRREELRSDVMSIQCFISIAKPKDIDDAKLVGVNIGGGGGGDWCVNKLIVKDIN